jgi:hypothetical protein
MILLWGHSIFAVRFSEGFSLSVAKAGFQLSSKHFPQLWA